MYSYPTSGHKHTFPTLQNYGRIVKRKYAAMSTGTTTKVTNLQWSWIANWYNVPTDEFTKNWIEKKCPK